LEPLLRNESLVRAMRVSTVWLVLFVLALPGFAAVRGLCCGPQGQGRSDCCVAADESSEKMRGMDSGAMTSMAGNSGLDGRVMAAGIDECAPLAVGEAPEYVVRSERSIEQRLVPAPSQVSALAGEAEVRSEQTSRFFKMDRTPPGLLRFDPLSIALRI
jgi:hypothetical protein